MNPRDQLGLGLGSLEELRVMTGVERPASVKEMLARYREPVVFDEALNTPDGVALGGHQTITFERDGGFRHAGHLRASGFPSFQYGVRVVFSNDAGVPLVTGQTGRVHGTSEPGDRESAWDKSDRNGLIALHWEAIRHARAATTLDRDSDFFGAFGDVAEFLGSLGVGAPSRARPASAWSSARTRRTRPGSTRSSPWAACPACSSPAGSCSSSGPARSSRRSWPVPVSSWRSTTGR
jgi:hypothetical protein